jgi:hypothetical protein
MAYHVLLSSMRYANYYQLAVSYTIILIYIFFNMIIYDSDFLRNFSAKFGYVVTGTRYSRRIRTGFVK